MKKKICLINLLFVVFALCYSQENTSTRNIFINGGYRVNGGEGTASIGYESSEIWQKLSVYSSLNLLDRSATITSIIVKEKDYFIEAGIKKTFLRNYSGSLFLTNDEECRRVVNILL